jgi:hypothetical protein
LKRIQAYNGTCVKQPQGILGPITPVAHARQINALSTLNLRPAARASWKFDARKARSLTDTLDTAAGMPDALETAAEQDQQFARHVDRVLAEVVASICETTRRESRHNSVSYGLGRLRLVRINCDVEYEVLCTTPSGLKRILTSLPSRRTRRVTWPTNGMQSTKRGVPCANSCSKTHIRSRSGATCLSELLLDRRTRAIC